MPTLELDDWEVATLRQETACKTLTYLGHYAHQGLRDSEVDTMNRYRALNAKLCGEPVPEPYPYQERKRR